MRSRWLLLSGVLAAMPAGATTPVVIPIEQVQRFGDPAVIFNNLNTPEDLADAERTIPTR